MSYRELERRYGFEVYTKRDVTLVRGEGATVWDDMGREYIDCAAGIGVASVGHANAAVAAAIAAQADTLMTCPGSFYNDVRARFLEKLVGIAPKGLSRAFLCNSGTESIEAAIKFARFTTGRTDFVSCMRGFHGRTLGSLSATFKKEYREPFAPIVPGFSYVPFNDLDKMAGAVTDRTAAVIVELVQGEGGIRVADAEFVRNLRGLCDERGVLLIVDEVQTGFCRTGRMFACEHFALVPDIMCLAKAMAGGMPIGATLCSERVRAPVGRHGTTFGGNPLACAAALAAIGFMEEQALWEQAAEKGDYFVRRLAPSLPGTVREIRHLGLMVGIELKEKATPYLAALLDRGVIALSAGPTVIRLLPPLVISYEQLDAVARLLGDVMRPGAARPAVASEGIPK